MSKPKKLMLMAAVLLLCLGIFLLLSSGNGEKSTTEMPIQVSTTEPDQVSALSWDVGGRTVSFRRDGTEWVCTSEKHFPTDSTSGLWADMLQALSSVTASRYLETVDDPAEYGLDLPRNVISAVLSDGTMLTWTIGAQNAVTGEYYLQLEGDPGVYLIDSTLPDAFRFGLFDLVLEDELPDLSDATVYQLEKSIYYRVLQEDGSTRWCRDAAGKQPLEETVSNRLSNGLTALQWSACIDFYADSDEVRSYEYNLEHGKTATITYPVSDDQTAQYTLIIGNIYDDSHTIVSPADSDLVYTIDQTVADALLLCP